MNNKDLDRLGVNAFHKLRDLKSAFVTESSKRDLEYVQEVLKEYENYINKLEIKQQKEANFEPVVYKEPTVLNLLPKTMANYAPISKGQNMVIKGGAKAGKTALALGIGLKAVKESLNVLYLTGDKSILSFVEVMGNPQQPGTFIVVGVNHETHIKEIEDILLSRENIDVLIVDVDNIHMKKQTEEMYSYSTNNRAVPLRLRNLAIRNNVFLVRTERTRELLGCHPISSKGDFSTDQTITVKSAKDRSHEASVTKWLHTSSEAFGTFTTKNIIKTLKEIV